MMLEFEWPWLAAVLVLPFLMLLIRPRQQQLSSALRVPDVRVFAGTELSVKRLPSGRFKWLLALLAYACLTLAAMRPVWVGESIEMPLTGRDLMLAIDLSLSMREEDMKLEGQVVSRIRATRQVASDFVRRRKGDRMSLIVFGAYPYLQTPLTFDRKTIEENILRTQPGDADDLRRRISGTAIGDAIGLAVKRLRDSDVEDKTLILLTDGSDNSSRVAPRKAAELAAQSGLKVHTIGIGSDRRTASLLGIKISLGRRSEIDEQVLKDIAEITGGRYFRAQNTDQLEQIYALIDQLEPVQSDVLSFRPYQSLFFYPLGGSLLCAALLLLWHKLGRAS